jgi:hypothetical protein
MLTRKRAGTMFLVVFAVLILAYWVIVIDPMPCALQGRICPDTFHPLELPNFLLMNPVPNGIIVLSSLVLFVAGLVIGRKNYWLGFTISLVALLAALLLSGHIV